MEGLDEILGKIEGPLLFLARDSYRNVSLVRDLENTMSGYLAELRRILSQQESDNNKEDYEGVISILDELFHKFDILDPEDRKERIEKALNLLERLKKIDTISQRNELEKSFDRLSLPVQYVKGVGPKMAALLSRKGLKVVEDMLYFLPRRYEDRRFVKEISQTVLGKRETVTGAVIDTRLQRYRRKGVFEVTFDDGTGLLTAKWFHGNSNYLRNTFRKGKKFFLTGEIRGHLFGKEMIHPDYELLDREGDDSLNVKRIIPVYSETEGLNQKYIRRIMMQVIENHADYVVSPIPSEICERNSLNDIVAAIKNIHFPDFDEEDIDALNDFKSEAHRRLVFDEFFFFELGMALKKSGYALEKGISFATDGGLVRKFLKILPFDLTDAQKNVIDEIMFDMKREYPMNRLLQGDVGSGKTVVSMCAMLNACENGYQAAIMAPTEILAGQHYSNIKLWAEKLGIKAAILTGGMKSESRRDLTAKIQNGDVNIVIGTHALIQEGLIFKKLGFVVIDEQHRFGVVQRVLIREKGITPDVLVMTATPIPRTLAMTVYGDLDISVIDEMPPGKKPIKTKVFYEKDREKVYDTIRKEVNKNNQVFIIYPLVEESEILDLKDATSMSNHLRENVFPQFRVGLIHGRMKSHEKDSVMNDFLNGNLDILVSTTVIEVGIDVPNASLMVVEHAERFGLSQLHQLRGRVGRSDLSSYCVLVAHHTGSEDSRKRLRIMEQTSDGFRISEEDLSIRGPGDFMGTRQSGLPDFRVANILRDAKILNQARKEAFMLLERDRNLTRPEHAAIKEVLLRRWGGRLELAKTG
jgi:ATP-dependent DNA helicase RecG